MIHLAIFIAIAAVIVIGAAMAARRWRARRAARGDSGRPLHPVLALLIVVAVGATLRDVVHDIVVARKPDGAAIAAKLSRDKTFPVRVNEQTQLDSVEGQGQVLTFSYTVTVPGRTVEDVSQYIQANHDIRLRALCAQPDMKSLIEDGLVIEHLFRYAAIPVGNVVASRSSCVNV